MSPTYIFPFCEKSIVAVDVDMNLVNIVRSLYVNF